MLESSLATEIIAASKRDELERRIAARSLREAVREPASAGGVRRALAGGLVRLATCLDARAVEGPVALGR